MNATTTSELPTPQALASVSGYATGDKISWTHVVPRGRSIGMTRREGEIVGFHTNQSGRQFALCKHKRGKEWVDMESIRKLGQPGHLTEFVMGMGEVA
jgi:hypothetical protein